MVEGKKIKVNGDIHFITVKVGAGCEARPGVAGCGKCGGICWEGEKGWVRWKVEGYFKFDDFEF